MVKKKLYPKIKRENHCRKCECVFIERVSGGGGLSTMKVYVLYVCSMVSSSNDYVDLWSCIQIMNLSSDIFFSDKVKPFFMRG